MEPTKAVTTVAERRQALAQKAREIDRVASEALAIYTGREIGMERELALAGAMQDLRAMLTPEVMAPIMSLADTDLGFRTDRDPKVMNQKTGQPNTPYPVDVVRDVVIEAKLRGFHTIGNEFNIISGRFYAAKNGFRRKLTDGKSFPGLTDFRDSYEVPRTVGDRGALVKCSASWKINGVPGKAEFEFAIKVNSFMGADAIVGKAERKLCKRVHDLLAGVSTPDGEAGEDPVAAAKPASAEPIFRSPVEKSTDDSDTAQARSVEPPAVNPGPAVPPATDAGDGPVKQLEELATGLGATFEDFRAFASEPFPDSSSWGSWSEVSNECASACLRARGRFTAKLTAIVEARKGAK